MYISFQTVCGSLTNLLKIKVGGNSNSSSNLSGNNDDEIPKSDLNINTAIDDLNKMTVAENKSTPAKKVTLEDQMTSQMDKLDSLIYKADNAQYSMSEQNKQMKKFLK